MSLALLAGMAAEANAYTVTVTPADQTTSVGSEISVAVTVGDVFPGGLGSYNLDLSFQGGVLGFDRVVDGMGMGGAFGLTYALNGDVLSLTDTSLDDVDTLLASQSASFTLFTVYFDALSEGTSFLRLSGMTLADAWGVSEWGVSGTDGSVTVQSVSAVPEPGTFPLILLGGIACVWAGRRNAARART
ncbi:MAG TPA: PEP-CTERM sorting domain-containing protein [Rhizobacter sp.]|nr:PEP-CTERM sorting domain-containing protein [Rhizobacter sp.]